MIKQPWRNVGTLAHAAAPERDTPRPVADANGQQAVAQDVLSDHASDKVVDICFNDRVGEDLVQQDTGQIIAEVPNFLWVIFEPISNFR